ncbi:MAG: hypothetical protein ABIO70_03960 [Pseudomonadota bacterium]
MRAQLLLLALAACHPDKDKPGEDTDEPLGPPTWDAEAEDVPCALDVSGSTPLLDAVLDDAGLSLAEVGYDEADWDYTSYKRYLDDAFLLPWFYEVHHDPLRIPCYGGQLAADLDHAGATPHPVATALGEAMERLVAECTLEPIDPASAASGLADLSSLPADLADALTPILQAMEAVAAARGAMEANAPEDAEWLVTWGHGGAITDLHNDPDFTEAGVQDWVLDPMSGPRALYDPARVLAFAIEEADLGRFAGTDASLDTNTSQGRIVVSGPDDDAPGDIGNVALYLDLGGNDTYLHPAGASSLGVPVAVHIDLSGDDAYGYEPVGEGTDALLPADADGRYRGDGYYGTFSLSETGRQGSGRFGVGMLFDLGGGADHYQSLRMSQGWAQLGVGVLYDDGGDDTYLAEAGAQGGASMGIGLFMDAGGNDVHRSFADRQGYAYVQAVGVAWDGGGDDDWYCNPGKEEDGGTTLYYSPQLPSGGNSSFSQGTGFGRRGDHDGAFLSGGLGVLRDASGDDSYIAGTFAQGSGYWQALGLLLDGDGHDQYDAYYYVQGGVAHYAAGALLDDGDGDDAYNTRMVSNYMQVGAGHDFSVGVIVDEGGDDTWVYGGLAGGASNCEGIGLFVDNDGSDTYLVSSAYSTGLGNHSGECIDTGRVGAPAIGLFMDSGGDADDWTWPGGDHPAPADDSSFGYDQNAHETEHGGAVDGDGETGVHAGGSVP